MRTAFLSTATTVLELAIVVTSFWFIFFDTWWAMLAWEGLALTYLGAGLVVVWPGRPVPAGNATENRWLHRVAWLFPLVASMAGVTWAVAALFAKSSSALEGDAGVAALASLGIVLSWCLLHVGFAQVYQLIDAVSDERGFSLPGDGQSSASMNYLYFSFTIGTSFATSDADILTHRVRRVVLVHSVVSFVYNALVVAVAFQVLQSLAA